MMNIEQLQSLLNEKFGEAYQLMLNDDASGAYAILIELASTLKGYM